MRQLSLVLLSILFYIPIFYSHPKETKRLNIGVISDIHYLSNSLMDKGLAIENFVKNSGKDVIDVPDVLDLVLQDYRSSNIDILLIPGDMTKDGEKQSHIELTEKLKPLIENGTKIFVIPGNHDINGPKSVGYKENETYRVDNVSPSDFIKIYNEFGYNNAIYRDSTSLSYVADLETNTWLIALDGCLYNDYKDKTISTGKLSNDTKSWIVDILNIAKNNNKQVVGMMHHGLIEHFPMQSIFFKDYLIEDNRHLANLLADNGVDIIFTGHFHANDITEFITEKGNKIYDIETGALCAYPFSYRFIELSRDKINIKTKNITETLPNPNLAENSKKNLKYQAQIRALSKINSMGITLDPDLKKTIANIASDMFIQHLAGDEVINDQLKESIKKISENFEDTYSLDNNNIELDYYPADNNIEIDFNRK